MVVKHPSSCAPCHLPNIDPGIDTSLAVPEGNLPCSVCGDAGKGSHMLLCDGCNSGWHLACLNPPLSSVPRGDWYCPACEQDQPELPRNRPAEAVAVAPASAVPAKSRSRVVAARQLEAAASQYDGSQIWMPARGKREGMGGVVRFLGVDVGAACYEAIFTDGRTMRLRPSAVEQLLVPAESARVAAVKPVTVTSQLPPRWLLDTYEHARRCLTSLAPGFWTEGHVIGLVMQADMFAGQPATSYQPADIRGCVHALSAAVDLPEQALDPWAVNNQGLQAALLRERVQLSPVASTPAEALYPEPYETLRKAGKPWSVVSSPSAYVVDLLVFLLSLYTPVMVAVLVPRTYLTHAPRARADALHRLEIAQRVVTVGCPVSGAHESVGSVWVVVFGNESVKRARVLGEVGDLLSLAA